MKKILSVLLVILLLCSCSATEGYEEFVKGVHSPPDVTVRYGDISLTATQGSCSWSYENSDGTETCWDGISEHPKEMKNIASFSAGDKKTAKLIFDKNMISYELTCYDMGKEYAPYEAGTATPAPKAEKVSCDNGVFEIPAEGNIYIYELEVIYKNGTCIYGFRIDPQDDWGITFSIINITPTGATVVFTQSGGNPTGELMVGSAYSLEYQDESMAFLVDDAIFTAEAYMIPKDGELKMNVNWEWLYGELEPGEYRITKSVMDFRGTGDYDTKEYSAEFTIGGKEIKSVSFMKIVDGAEDGNLVLASDSEGVITLSVNDIPVFLDGEQADSSAIMDGMTAHIYHSGEILETYPASFDEVYEIHVFSIGTKNQVGGTLFDLCGLYLKVLDDLWEVDSGLNADAEYVSIDLSEAPGEFTESEKAAIAWIFGNKHDVMALNLTYEELIENGYLTAAGGSNDLYQWDNGVLLSITQKQKEEPDAYFGLRKIEFNATKWRSPLGAYMFFDCSCVWPQMGTWTDYNIGSQAIS